MGRYDEGHVVEEFKIGNTQIKICDDYCRDKTPEEVDAILARIARTAQRSLTVACYNDKKLTNKKRHVAKANAPTSRYYNIKGW